MRMGEAAGRARGASVPSADLCASRGRGGAGTVRAEAPPTRFRPQVAKTA